ncbi:unnamed protein product [Ilex paraguariensis]|uniref:Uncharacterized protein n=1 Tax=Ilex paraguariensis TaxID=185542 RepID=A0ABC8RZK0_9AQUA
MAHSLIYPSHNSHHLYSLSLSRSTVPHSFLYSMKFLLELVSCCGTISRPSVPTSPPPADETRCLVPSTPPESRRKRGRVASKRSAYTPQWRPSLHAISEDNVVVESKERAVVGSERVLKRKVEPPTGKVRIRSCSDDSRRPPLQAIMPTPFLF